jgi:hypothetical protein
MQISINLFGTQLEIAYDGDALVTYLGPPPKTIDEAVEDVEKEMVKLGGSFERQVPEEPEDDYDEDYEEPEMKPRKFGFTR